MPSGFGGFLLFPVQATKAIPGIKFKKLPRWSRAAQGTSMLEVPVAHLVSQMHQACTGVFRNSHRETRTAVPAMINKQVKPIYSHSLEKGPVSSGCPQHRRGSCLEVLCGKHCAPHGVTGHRTSQPTARLLINTSSVTPLIWAFP